MCINFAAEKKNVCTMLCIMHCMEGEEKYSVLLKNMKKRYSRVMVSTAAFHEFGVSVPVSV